MRNISETEERYELAVVGGGISGISFAIAAAREGVKTVLIQDRPVLGGNASSEVRMHICGAGCQGRVANARETGIIEEILLANKAKNPDFSYAEFDRILWEKVRYQENLTLYMSTSLWAAEVRNNTIKSVTVRRLTEERDIRIVAKMYADCTGDGTLGYLAGAEYMYGREGKTAFWEANAKEIGDECTMGNSIMFKAKDAGHKVEYERPFWANNYREAEWVKTQSWEEIDSGYWWIEVGGKEFETLKESEQTREECYKIIYGVWDYIKNCLGGRADNLQLEWVGSVPAKREGRRFVGAYVLREQDVTEHKIFPYAVGYGGWHIDDHPAERFKHYANIKKYDTEDLTVHHNGIYTIPYRCLYSKNIKNLYMGGRLISVTHRALSSTRVMATCAVLGEAGGVASALAIKGNIAPEEVNVKRVQEILIKNDCYIPSLRDIDKGNIALKSKVRATSELSGYGAENAINGYNRPIGGETNMWRARKGASIEIIFEKAERIRETRITFDSDLSADITQTLSNWIKARQPEGVPNTLIKDFKAEYYLGEELVSVREIKNNERRMVTIKSEVECTRIKIIPQETYGSDYVSVCEIKAYR